MIFSLFGGKKYWVFLPFYSLLLPLQAQEADTSIFAPIRQKVIQFQADFAHDSVIHYAEQARAYAEKHQLVVLQLEFTVRQRLALMRRYRGFVDQPYALFQRVLPLGKELLVLGDSSLWIAKAFEEMVEIHRFRQEFDLANQSLFQAYEALPHSLWGPSSVKGSIFITLANYYFEKEEQDIDSASYFLNLARPLIQEVSEEMLDWLGTAAMLAKHKKNLIVAENYLLQQIPVAEATHNVDYRDMITYYELANTAMMSGDYDLALEYLGPARRGARKDLLYSDILILKEEYEEALKILRIIKWSILYYGGFSMNYLPSVYNTMSRAHLGLERFDSTAIYLNLALDTKIHPSIRDTVFHTLGNINLSIRQREYNRALHHITFLQTIDHLFRSNTGYQIVFAYRTYESYLGLQQYREALAALDQGLNSIYENRVVPTQEHALHLDRLSNPHHLFSFVSAKGHVRLEQFHHQRDQASLDSALHYFQEADRIVDSLRKKFRGNEVRGVLANRAFPCYVRAIQTCHLLFQASGQQSFLDQAFYFAEKSKSLRLHQAVSESEARQFLAVPDSLLAKEKELLKNMQYYERRIATFQEKHFTLDEKGDTLFFHTLMEVHSRKLRNTRQAYQELVEKFEREFPEYYFQKFQTDVTSLSEVQRKCRQEQSAMLEFVVGDSQIYAFGISPDTIMLKVILSQMPLDSSIQELRSSLYAYWLADQRTDDMYAINNRKYCSLAYQLYQQLIEPMATIMGEVDQLTIIPDGSLGYLPFEILLSKHPEHPDQYRHHAYLLRQASITYAFSSTIHLKRHRKTFLPRSSKILAIRPSFPSSDETFEDITALRRDGFAPLRFTEQEIAFIKERFGAQTLQDSLATKELVLKAMESKQYSIIHFATHSKSHDEQPRKAKIAFTAIEDSTEDNDFLTFPEIFNLRLNADMVVLSACETGLGEFQKGEGIMSLSRAFAFAGAKSIITTLWSVDDRSTAELIQDFYQELDAGKDKSEAMQQAKLTYLQTHDHRFAHPFFWAGPVVIGDPSPIRLSTPIWSWKHLLCILAGLLLLGVTIARKLTGNQTYS